MWILLALLIGAYVAGVATPVLFLRGQARRLRALEVSKQIKMLEDLKEKTDQKLRALEWEREYKKEQ